MPRLRPASKASSEVSSARRMLAALAALLALLSLAVPAAAQSFPPLTGRVVDAAHVLPADEVARLDQQLAALQTQSQRQLVVATIPDLQGYDIEDYGYRLGRAWGIGSKAKNDGIILIVAPHARKVRIEVGYGLEGVITDGLSALIIQNVMLPRFRDGDLAGGVEAGADALMKQLSLPEDQARQIAASARPVAGPRTQIGPAILWLGFIFLFFILPVMRRMRGGGSTYGGGWGPVMMWGAMNALGGRSEGGWGGGGFGDGGGFSGGGGSFGGGGASGSW